MYFVFIYKNRRMNPVEFFSKQGEKRNEEEGWRGKSNTYVNLSTCKYHSVQVLNDNEINF
jgi:hypothetical protein